MQYGCRVRHCSKELGSREVAAVGEVFVGSGKAAVREVAAGDYVAAGGYVAARDGVAV